MLQSIVLVDLISG